jgi:hypothetical protein
MSGCALRRWGSGTPCTKEPQANKEMAAALAAMKAEREKQDTMWQLPASDEVKVTDIKPLIKSIKDNR